MNKAKAHGNSQNVVHDVFETYDTSFEKELNAIQLQTLYDEIRFGGLSLPQVRMNTT